MRPTVRSLFALLAAGLLAAAARKDAGEPAAADLSAAQILERMATVYANCKSYRDAGVVQETIVPAALAGVVHPDESQAARIQRSSKPFRTAFVRPGQFRFEYSDSRHGRVSRYIVWEDGADVRTWWDVKPEVERPGSLSMAVAGATGVSGMSAHIVPRLLIPLQVSGTALTELAEAQRLEDADVEGERCFCLKGKLATWTRTIWVDARTSLVRKIVSEVKDESILITNTTTYEPEIDVEISAGELAFDPPQAK